MSTARRLSHRDRLSHESRRRRRPGLESLESRVVLSTLTWTGAVSSSWSVGGNWVGGVAPQAGDALVFPAGATSLSSVNNLTPGTSFASIDIQAPGYDISGASVELTGNLTASLTTGLAIDSLATKLDSGVVNVAPGGQLFALGVFSGTAGLELTGGGTMAMIGSAANTYIGTTTVDNGTLNLENTTSNYAVPGNLVIGGSGQGNVFESNSDQINPAGTVTINSNGLLNLQGQMETIGGLDLIGSAQIYTGLANSINAGILTLNGDVTVDGTSGTPSITGTLNLGPANRTFTVTAGNVDLSGFVQGSYALIKAGAGTLTLNSNLTYNDPAAVNINAGTLYFESGSTIDASSTAGITVASGATMWTVNVGTVNVPVSLVGSGVSSVGALHDTSYGDKLTNVTLAGNVSIGADDSSPGLTISNSLTDGGSAYSLTKVGNGILILSGTNTYTGGTTVSAGELYVSGSITGAVQTSGTGELGGSGTVGTATTSGGTIGAGQTANWDPQIEHYSSLTLDSTATFSAQVLGSSPGQGGYDQVVVSGAVALNSATLSLPTNGLPSNVVTMDLIKGATSLTGTFHGLAEGGVVTISGYDFKITYVGGTGGHDVVLNRVVPTTTSVAIPTNSSVFSQPDTFTATVSTTQGNTPTGIVTFYSGTTNLGTGTLSGSTATVTTGVLPVGSDSITAVYNGDTNDLTSNSNLAPVTQIVIQDNSATTVTTSSATTVFGQSVTFTATATASLPGAGIPTGTVDFYDGTTLLGSPTLDNTGTATFTTSALSTGTHNISVSYMGDSGFFKSNSSTITQTVGQASSSVALVTSNASTTYGDPVTFTATVSAVTPGAGTPSGTVTFYDGTTSIGTGTLNGTGTATLNISTLDASSHSITATYGGDTNFLTSTTATATTQAVAAMGTTTTLAIAPTTSAEFGQSVTLTATVAQASGTNIPAGTVTFYDGVTSLGTGTLDATGKATLSTSTLSNGAHSLSVSYAGVTDFTTSTSSTQSYTISLAPPTINLTSTTNPAATNESIVIDVSVSPPYAGAAMPTGSVAFYNGTTQIGTGTLDVNGAATITIPPLTFGTYPITVHYAGDSNYQAETSTILNLSVEKATVTSLAPVGGPLTFGQTETLTATVAPLTADLATPSGTVTFYDGTTALGTGTLNGSGTATFNAGTLAAGSHTIKAVYGSDSIFAMSTSTTETLVVNQSGTSTALATSAASPAFGQSVMLSATVTPVAPGTGTPTGTVSYYDGATLLGTGSLIGGVATLSLSNLSVASHSITATYNGDPNFQSSTSTTTSEAVVRASTNIGLISSDTGPTYGQSITLTATVGAVAPGAGTPSGTVTFYDGTTAIGQATLSGSPATATLSIATLDAGARSITAAYSGNVDFTGATSSAVQATIHAASTTTVLRAGGVSSTFGQPETLTATVATVPPGSGMPTGSVAFFAGTTQIGTANLIAGVATLSTTNIPRGSQTLTAQFEGSGDFLSSYSPPVGQVVSESSTQTVLSGGGAMVLGLPASITATVLPVAPATAIPTGFVLFEDGSVPIATVPLDARGVAQLSTADFGVGTHAITAIYGGNAGYTISATSSSVSVAVTPDLTGMVYLDLQSNSVSAVSTPVPGGLGLGGQVVFLDLHHIGTLVPGDPTAITDANGVFQFPGYAPDSATVLVQTTMGTGGHFSVVRTGLDASGHVAIGVVPTSTVAPVPISPAPGSSTPTNPRESFVQELYLDVLGRAPTANEEAHWVRRLNHGVSRRQVAHAVFDSVEHRQQEVAAYSKAFLGTSSLAGSDRLVRRLRRDGSEQAVVRSILNSPAYQSAHADPSLLVRDLYLEVLGQQPTSTEVAGWTSLLSAGLSRRVLVDRFVNSAAVDEQIVQSFYAIYLHTQPNAAEIRDATAILESRGGSATKLAVNILGSRAFEQVARG